MTDKPKKATEPPLRLGMAFDEAFARFARTDPAEVAASIDRSKTKKPPDNLGGRLPNSSKSKKRGEP